MVYDNLHPQSDIQHDDQSSFSSMLSQVVQSTETETLRSSNLRSSAVHSSSQRSKKRPAPALLLS